MPEHIVLHVLPSPCLHDIRLYMHLEIGLVINKTDAHEGWRKNKDYQKADEIRNKLLDMGIMLKDTREGTTYEVVK